MSYGDTRYMELEKLITRPQPKPESKPFPRMIGYKKIAEQLLQGMSKYEQIRPYKNTEEQLSEKDTHSRYQKFCTMDIRIELAYKVEKLLFQFYIAYGHTRIGRMMFKKIAWITKREKQEIPPIVQAFLKAGWTPQQHLTLQLERNRRNIEFAKADCEAREHIYKEPEIKVERNPFIDYENLQKQKQEREARIAYEKELKEKEREFQRWHKNLIQKHKKKYY